MEFNSCRFILTATRTGATAAAGTFPDLTVGKGDRSSRASRNAALSAAAAIGGINGPCFAVLDLVYPLATSVNTGAAAGAKHDIYDGAHLNIHISSFNGLFSS
jgi:hypothetical protein